MTVRANCHPSVRIFVADVDSLPNVILLPTNRGCQEASEKGHTNVAKERGNPKQLVLF